MASKNIKIVILALVVLLTSTGCWDRVEINDRLFVLAAGVDSNEPGKSGQKNQREYHYTYLLPSFSSISEGIPSGKDANIVYKAKGRSSYEAIRHITERTNSRPYFQHMKAFIFGKDTIKSSYNLLEQLDAMERQDEISRKIHIFVAKDKATDVLNVGLSTTHLGLALQGMGNKNRIVESYIPKTLEEVITEISQGCALIPRIDASETEIRVSGSAIIKDQRFIGWLEQPDTKSVAFMTNQVKKGMIQIEDEGKGIVYIISNIKSKKKAGVEDGKIKVDINIATEGIIQQYKIGSKPRLDNKEYIRELEKLIKADIKRDLNKTIDNLQNNLKVDVLKIDEHLNAHEPDIWKQVKDDWEEVFPSIDINVNVDSRIREYGTIK